MGLLVAKKLDRIKGLRRYALAVNPKFKAAKLLNKNVGDIFRRKEPLTEEYEALSKRNLKAVLYLDIVKYAAVVGAAYGLSQFIGGTAGQALLFGSSAFLLGAKGINFFGDYAAEHIEGGLKHAGLSSHKAGVLSSMSTSLPEFISSLFSSFQHGEAARMAASNFIGSNMFNPLILGPLAVSKEAKELVKARKADIMAMFITSGLGALFLATGSVLTFAEGAALAGVGGLYLAYQFFRGKDAYDTNDKPSKNHLIKHLTGMILGGAALAATSYVVVGALGSTITAVSFSGTIAGALFLAGATSLPELSVTLSTKKRMDKADDAGLKRGLGLAAMDTIIKSNIVNMAFMGVVAMVNPLAYEISKLSDVVAMLSVEALIVLAMSVKNKPLKYLLLGAAGSLWALNLTFHPFHL